MKILGDILTFLPSRFTSILGLVAGWINNFAEAYPDEYGKALEKIADITGAKGESVGGGTLPPTTDELLCGEEDKSYVGCAGEPNKGDIVIDIWAPGSSESGDEDGDGKTCSGESKECNNECSSDSGKIIWCYEIGPEQNIFESATLENILKPLLLNLLAGGNVSLTRRNSIRTLFGI